MGLHGLPLSPLYHSNRAFVYAVSNGFLSLSIKARTKGKCTADSMQITFFLYERHKVVLKMATLIKLVHFFLLLLIIFPSFFFFCPSDRDSDGHKDCDS